MTLAHTYNTFPVQQCFLYHLVLVVQSTFRYDMPVFWTVEFVSREVVWT